jgi:hypothetical protein
MIVIVEGIRHKVLGFNQEKKELYVQNQGTLEKHEIPYTKVTGFEYENVTFKCSVTGFKITKTWLNNTVLTLMLLRDDTRKKLFATNKTIRESKGDVSALETHKLVLEAKLKMVLDLLEVV